MQEFQKLHLIRLKRKQIKMEKQKQSQDDLKNKTNALMNFHQEKCAEKKLAETRACSQQKTKTFNPTSIIDDFFD